MLDKLEARVLVQRVVLDGAMVVDEVAVLDGTTSLAGTEVLNETEVPGEIAVSDGIAVSDETMALDVVETPGTLSKALEVCDAPGSRPQTVSVIVTTPISSIKSAPTLPIGEEKQGRRTTTREELVSGQGGRFVFCSRRWLVSMALASGEALILTSEKLQQRVFIFCVVHASYGSYRCQLDGLMTLEMEYLPRANPKTVRNDTSMTTKRLMRGAMVTRSSEPR